MECDPCDTSEDLELMFQLVDERGPKRYFDIKARSLAEKEEWVAEVLKVHDEMG